MFARICLLLLLFALQTPVNAEFYFLYEPTHEPAQKALCELRLAEAESLIASLEKKTPENLAVHYLRHYLSFYQIMMLQEKQHLPQFKLAHQNYLDKLDKLPSSSPYKEYTRSSALLMDAVVLGAFSEYLGAAKSFRNAYLAVKANSKQFPNFISNKKEMGALQAMIGSFPSQYQWLVQAVGLEGNIDQGLQLLSQYCQTMQSEPLIERQQAAIFYSLIHLNFGDKNLAWKFYKDYAQHCKTNLMETYVLAYIGGKTGHNDESIDLLKRKPSNSNYTNIPYLNFLMAEYLLRKLDFEADIWYKKYLLNSVGKGSAKDAYVRLSWISLMQGDKEKYHTYQHLAEKQMKKKGSEYLLTQQDQSIGIYPNIVLLKCRLLFDGGYYQEAIILMKNQNGNTLPSAYQRTEWYYRLGRIYHETSKKADAIKHYKECLELGKGLNTYLLPNACLQLGYLYADLGYKELAISYFEKVNSYSDYDYEDSLKQKAKAGMQKLK